MSQYQISKKRLAEIIKEEYANLHEAPYLDMPPEDRPFSDDEGVESAKLEIGGTMKPTLERAKKLSLVSGLGFEPHHMRQALHQLVDDVFAPQTEAKQAKKDYDGDGEVESSTEEWKGSRDKAIKKNKGKGKKEEDEEEDKEVKESLISLRKLIAQEIKNL
jgi:hypothetical protein